VGQGHITGTLVNAIKSERLAHAYLFSGARGVGKTSVARILAKAMNCMEGEPGVPCNKCRSCVEITNGSSVDVQEIDGASNRGIDEIRELRENSRYMPSSSRYRIYIIDEVHMLTKEAFNALLKTLEEPPPHVKFFFATTEPHKVPITILSRCQRFDFKRIPPGLIVEQLQKIAEAEEIRISREGLALIARESEGGMRDAQSLLDQVVSYTGPEVEDSRITEILGIVDRGILFEASRAVLEGDARACIRLVEDLYNRGYEIKEFYNSLMEQFRNLLVSLIVSDGRITDMTESDLEELKAQASRAGREKLQQILNILIRREEDLRFTSSPRIILEAILIKLCRMSEVLAFDELMAKLENLENRLGQGAAQGYAPSGESPPAAVQEPAHAAEEVPEDPPPAEPEETPRRESFEEGGWEAFMSFLSSKNHVMGNVLKEWGFVSLEGGTLTLERSENPFSASYLDDQDHRDKFRELAGEFFGRTVNVKITGRAKPKNRKTPARRGDPGDKPNNEKTVVPRPVQEVMDLFQGELREEDSAPTAGPESGDDK